ncbi:MAG: zinc metalloprotease HtpX [Candidatus Thermoplasmatota archaeon]|nr:zinc metalloprotease HtpX [Candidatus Thermoplasmatota archaeon]
MMARLRLLLLFTLLTLIMMGVGLVAGAYFGTSPTGAMTIFFVIAVLINIGSYFWSDKLVLRAYKARVVEQHEAPQLFGVVKKVAQMNDLPMPRVAIVPSQTPNAFATGRSPQHAVVAATEGLMRMLDRDELEGVMAHEMGHVKNRDTLVMAVAATIAGAIAFAARILWWNSIFGRNRNVHPALLILVILTAPLAAFLLQAAVSRQREFKADATAAALTGKPWALVNALRKLEHGNSSRPMEVGSPAHAALCIANPLRGSDMLVNMFSTHPPMQDRIDALEAL